MRDDLKSFMTFKYLYQNTRSRPTFIFKRRLVASITNSMGLSVGPSVFKKFLFELNIKNNYKVIAYCTTLSRACLTDININFDISVSLYISFLKLASETSSSYNQHQYIQNYCQAQPKSQPQLGAEVALISIQPSHPPIHPSKKELEFKSDQKTKIV